LEKFWKKLGTGPELLAKFKKAWENAKKSANKAWDNITSATKKFFGYFKPTLEPAKNLLDDFWATLTNISEGNYEEAGKALGRAFLDAIELIKSLFKGLWQSITDDSGEISFDKVIEKAKVLADSIKDFIWGAIKTITPRLIAELAKLPRVLGKGLLTLASSPYKLTKMLFEWLETGEVSTELVDPKYIKEAKEIYKEAKKLIDEDRRKEKGIAESSESSFKDYVPPKKELGAAAIPSATYNSIDNSKTTTVNQNFYDNSNVNFNTDGDYKKALELLSKDHNEKWSKIGKQASTGVAQAMN
jgi:hypothetical protein